MIEDERPLSALPKVRLTRIEQLDPNVRVDFPNRQFDGIEFQPDGSKRYLFVVEVGNAAPEQVQGVLDQVKRMLKGFMPDGTTLVIPSRKGMPALGIYEVTPA